MIQNTLKIDSKLSIACIKIALWYFGNRKVRSERELYFIHQRSVNFARFLSQQIWNPNTQIRKCWDSKFTKLILNFILSFVIVCLASCDKRWFIFGPHPIKSNSSSTGDPTFSSLVAGRFWKKKKTSQKLLKGKRSSANLPYQWPNLMKEWLVLTLKSCLIFFSEECSHTVAKNQQLRCFSCSFLVLEILLWGVFVAYLNQLNSREIYFFCDDKMLKKEF